MNSPTTTAGAGVTVVHQQIVNQWGPPWAVALWGLGLFAIGLVLALVILAGREWWHRAR